MITLKLYLTAVLIFLSLNILQAQTNENSPSQIEVCDFTIQKVQVPDTNFYQISKYSIFGGNKKQLKSIRTNAPFRETSFLTSVDDIFICNYLEPIKNEGKLKLDKCVITYENYQNLGTIIFELYYTQKTD